jgi:hypothetical protein
MADFKWQLYGGATRPDAVSGLDERFKTALAQLYATAPPEIQKELGLTSAYRSKAVQQQLWDKSDKTGKTVAAPGRSKHNFGKAADLYGFGLKDKGNVSQATKDWVKANSKAHNLYFPMSYEPWHIQLAADGGGAQPQAQAVMPSGQQLTTLMSKDKLETMKPSFAPVGDAATRPEPVRAWAPVDTHYIPGIEVSSKDNEKKPSKYKKLANTMAELSKPQGDNALWGWIQAAMQPRSAQQFEWPGSGRV